VKRGFTSSCLEVQWLIICDLHCFNSIWTKESEIGLGLITLPLSRKAQASGG
jgi:hypothetical protein